MGKLMYKGFSKDLKCRGFQYEVGKEYVHEGEVSACESGFHACENPFDVLEFYAPNELHRFCEVEGSGKEDKLDKKSSFEKIRIVAEIGLGGLIKAGVKFCLDRVKWSDGASATGNYSGASATGNCSGASATGYKSGASAGKGSVALSVGLDTRAKGSLGSWIVLTQCHHDEDDGEDYIDIVKVAKVDGKRIKADTWYTLKEGKFVLADDDDY